MEPEKQNLINYMVSASILRQMLLNGLITEEEMDRIDSLNRIAYSQFSIEG